MLDDQPIWVKTANGPILAIPYSAEINDITMMVSHHHESDVLLDRTRDAFDRLYLESKESTRILAIGVHPYVTGQAHRIKYFEQLYAYINKHPGVVHWTGQQIYDWYVKQVPKPKSCHSSRAPELASVDNKSDAGYAIPMRPALARMSRS